MVTLESANLTLDIIVKTLLLLVLLLIALLVYHIDRAVRSANSSIKSVGDAAERVKNALTFGKILRMLKGQKDK